MNLNLLYSYACISLQRESMLQSDRNAHILLSLSAYVLIQWSEISTTMLEYKAKTTNTTFFPKLVYFFDF